MTRVFLRQIEVGLTKSLDSPENVISIDSTLFHSSFTKDLQARMFSCLKDILQAQK